MPTKFLINPISGSREGPRLWRALRAACARLGYVEAQDYSLEWTRPGQTVEQARRAAAAWDRVVAVGGDGTVRQVAEGLVRAGTGAALAVVPQGTGNDFSRAVGLYALWRRRDTLGLERVIEWFMTAPTRPVDVLAANDRLSFVCYASLGFDARVSQAYERLRYHPALRPVLRGRLLNECTYVVLGLRHSRMRLPEIRLQLQTPETTLLEQVISGGTCALIISNVSSYAGGAQLLAETCPGDRQFEVTLVPSVWRFPLLMASRLWPRLHRSCRLPGWRVQGVCLSLPPGCAVQVDGEDCTASLAGCRELAIRVAGQIPVVFGPSRSMSQRVNGATGQ